jgi:hypothetical protein
MTSSFSTTNVGLLETTLQIVFGLLVCLFFSGRNVPTKHTTTTKKNTTTMGACWWLLGLLVVVGWASGGRIDTVVVLMEENRSFDHMLGWMARGGPQGDSRVDGLTGAECNARNLSLPATGANLVCVTDSALDQWCVRVCLRACLRTCIAP